MTKKFEFRNRELNIDIAGHVFHLAVNSALTNRMMEFGKEAQEKAKVIVEGDPSSVDDTIDFCLDAIDCILGDGAADQIFAGREEDLIDCIDVMNYIADSIKEFDKASKIQRKDIPPQTMNRRQRRHTKA